MQTWHLMTDLWSGEDKIHLAGEATFCQFTDIISYLEIYLMHWNHKLSYIYFKWIISLPALALYLTHNTDINYHINANRTYDLI